MKGEKNLYGDRENCIIENEIMEPPKETMLICIIMNTCVLLCNPVHAVSPL